MDEQVLLNLQVIIDSIELADSVVINWEEVQRAVENRDSYQDYRPEEKENPIIGMSIFFTILISSIAYLIVSPHRQWRNGRFPWILRYNQKNLFDAYLVLGVIMIRKEHDDIAGQFQYFRRYLHNKFRDGQDYSRRHLADLMRLNVSEESTLNWLRRKMPEEERIQIIDFLVDLTFYNHTASRQEIRMINHVAKVLGISKAEVNSILSIRFEYYERLRNQQQSRSTRVPRQTKRTNCLKVLGLDETASMDLIKSTYRNLAKKLHPDRFVRLSASEQKMAHERFTEINLAYEYLEKNFG